MHGGGGGCSTDGIGDGVVQGRQAGEHDQVEVGLVLGHVVQQEPGNVQHVHQPATPKGGTQTTLKTMNVD